MYKVYLYWQVNDLSIKLSLQLSLIENKNDLSMSCKYKNNGWLCDKL
jgi:hypothetical protein